MVDRSMPLTHFSEGGTVKDNILAILSEEFPLSAKELSARMKRLGKDVTYQAVHKTVQLLQEQQVLDKINGKYRIRKEWIESIRDHLTILEHQYQERPSAKKILERLKRESITLHFNSLTALSVFTAELLVAYREKMGHPSPNIAFLRHAWWPLKFEPSQFFLFRKMDDNNSDNRVVVIKEDPFDQWIVRYYKLQNTANRLLFEKKAEWKEDLISKGDLAIQIQYDTKTLKRMDQIYKRISNLTQLFDSYFVNVEKDEGFDIEMTLSVNPTLARFIREKVKSYFGE